MGNEQTGGKTFQQAQMYGGMYVKPDRDMVVPEETFSGTVYLELKQPYPGDLINLEFKGKEKVHWIDAITRQRNRPDGTIENYTEYIHRKEHRIIMKTAVCIYDWKAGNRIPQGQYTFPFSFLVPKGLPGSFFIKRVHVYAEVKYRVKAVLQPENIQIPLLQYKLPLQMREKLAGDIVTESKTISQDVTTCCCFNQGKVNITTYFEKNAYAPEEVAKVASDVDNGNCKIDVSSVIFNLTQTITLRAEGHSKVLSFPVKSSDLGRIPAGSSWMGDKRVFADLQLPPSQEGVRKRADDDNDPELRNYDGSDDGKIVPSVHGSLISSDFALNVIASMDGCICCGSNPTTSLGIQVYAGALKKKDPPPQPPPNWQPQQMPPANLVITIRPRADGGQDIIIETGGPQPQNNMMNNSMPNNNMNPNQGYPGQYQNQQQMGGMNQSMGMNQQHMGGGMNQYPQNQQMGGYNQQQMGGMNQQQMGGMNQQMGGNNQQQMGGMNQQMGGYNQQMGGMSNNQYQQNQMNAQPMNIQQRQY